MQPKPIKFKFSLLPGDLINALAGVKQVCDKYSTTAEIYLGLDIAWNMTEEVAEGRDSKVTLTKKSMDMLKPLLMSQYYISKVESLEEYFPELFRSWIDAFHDMADHDHCIQWYMDNPMPLVDLDKHHLMPFNLQHSSVFRWNFYTYPDMTCDLSKPWIELPNIGKTDTIIVNRTSRARNKNITYDFLKKYEGRLIFLGTEKEHKEFDYMPLWTCENFLQIAEIIHSSQLFVGNQSLCFSIAEAMKIPRVLELNPHMPNVIPTGSNGYDCIFDQHFQWAVDELAKP